MAPPFSKPVFVIAPGAALQPAHYGLLMHLLMSAGYGVVSSMLPRCATDDKVTVEDDARYIRERMILPVLENEGHDVIVIGHSYSGLPTSAAATGLSRQDRIKAGKTTAVLGQIYISALVTNGGEGKNLVDTFGGRAPSHVKLDKSANRVRCEDPIPPLFHDLPETLGRSAVASCMDPSLTSFQSPVPPASLKEDGYKGRLAYIRSTIDAAVPTFVQDMLMVNTGVNFITRETMTGHNPQLAQPEKLCEIIIELAEHFEKL